MSKVRPVWKEVEDIKSWRGFEFRIHFEPREYANPSSGYIWRAGFVESSNAGDEWRVDAKASELYDAEKSVMDQVRDLS